MKLTKNHNAGPIRSLFVHPAPNQTVSEMARVTYSWRVARDRNERSNDSASKPSIGDPFSAQCPIALSRTCKRHPYSISPPP